MTFTRGEMGLLWGRVGIMDGVTVQGSGPAAVMLAATEAASVLTGGQADRVHREIVTPAGEG
jgi:hypothetical protein